MGLPVSRIFQRVIFVLSVFVFVALGLGFLLGQFNFFGVHAGQQDGAYRQMGIYADVLKKVQGEYVTEPNMTDVTTGALHGLLESLDNDSSYLTPTEYKIYKERPASSTAQVGITVAKRFVYAVIVSVVPGSPADKQHLTDGDVIETIGDQSTRDLSLAVIRLMLEGKPGTELSISVVRPRKPDADKITLSRTAVAPTPLAEQQYEAGSIEWLKPGPLTAARVDEVAAKIKAAKGHKILLDLRDSSSGDLNEGLRLANLFVKEGTLATLEGQKFANQIFSADPARCLTASPLTVLVNRGTAGPAELAAQALLDLKRADVVGEHTFGDASVQRTIELQDGAALLLTVAKYKSPSGKKIQDEGVTPSVVVGRAIDEEDDENAQPKGDEALNTALDLLKAKAA